MTDYDTLVFIFFWCDLAQQLAFVHARVQERKLQISDVGRSITLLCNRLKDVSPYSLALSKIASELGENLRTREIRQALGKNRWN